MNPPPLESVTVIFMHEQQVFAVQRQPYLLAFPGYHAFPGGKIDPDESLGVDVTVILGKDIKSFNEISNFFD